MSLKTATITYSFGSECKKVSNKKEINVTKLNVFITVPVVSRI
jgi:hypothetical protein